MSRRITEFPLNILSIIAVVMAVSFSNETWSTKLDRFIIEGQLCSHDAQTPGDGDDQSKEKSTSSEYRLENTPVRINENVGKCCLNERYYRVLHYYAICTQRINEQINFTNGYIINPYKFGLQHAWNASIPIVYRRLLI